MTREKGFSIKQEWLDRAFGVFLFLSGIFIAARLFFHDGALLFIWFNSFTAYVYLPAYLVLIWAIVFQRKKLMAGGLLVCAFHLYWVAPDYLPVARASPIEQGDPLVTGSLKIMSANLLMINQDPRPLVREIVESDADILLLQEYSPRWQKALKDAKIEELYPYNISQTQTDSFGTAIFSRTAIEAKITKHGGIPFAEARLNLNGKQLHIVNVHTLPPIFGQYVLAWRSHFAWLFQLTSEEPDGLIFMGDFNVTQHGRYYHDLKSLGLLAAHEETGRASATTYPNGRSIVPAIRLDHLFHTPDLSCTEIVEGEGSGSDHRPLIAQLKW